MEFSAVIEKDEDKYIAKCSEVGTVSQGETVEEAIENLKEATELYLEEFPLKRNLQNCSNFSKRSLKRQNLAVLGAANFANGIIQTSLNKFFENISLPKDICAWAFYLRAWRARN